MSETTSLTPKAGDEAILARRYAGVLYALADEAGSIDKVADELRALRQLWAESAEWRLIAADPRLSSEEAGLAATQVVKSCGFGQLTGNFLALVAQNRRLSVLPGMIDGFLEELAARRGEFTADVRSARALSAAQREALIASLNKIAGGKVHLTVSEDAGLLGGMTVKLGSVFIDASVKSKLDKLERTLKGAA
ncbi:MAG: F0F1 ATP synthase subunit delta [Alphaproteobacteria bacterium]|nr:F0F1 ATP synthase subunit delta [Alphaproteobacteria bacterium]